jgi:TetR/AcrR family transcriptional regulator, ethionamide resistance regulator
VPGGTAASRRDISDSAAARRIIGAMEALLVDRSLEAISVADVLDAAGVARGTFYLWFTSKYDVVVQAHRGVMATILDDAAVFFGKEDADERDLRAAIEAFVATWELHGPVLAASAELWRSQPELSEEWRQTMQTLVDAVAERIAERRPGIDPAATAHALIWMNERTAYMAAAGMAPVTLGPDLVDTLTHVWARVILDP